MSPVTDVMQGDLAAALSDSLERERRLGQIYRQELQAAWSLSVRRLWEEGWVVKREHEHALLRLLGSVGSAGNEDAKAARSIPSAREVFSWLYDQEGMLAAGYREFARLATDPDTQRVLYRFADEQHQLAERVRATYRDYSVA